jgi:phosphoserine aminotransferase
MLPEPVLEQAKNELLDWHGHGMGVMEMSHRSPEFISIAEEAESYLRDLMQIPDNYKVLFLQGGATGQFSAIPMNLAAEGETADYVVTGMWGKKAAAEARKYLSVNIAAQTDPYTNVPPVDEWNLSSNAAYVHITPNETIHGVKFDTIPDVGNVPLVGDISSMILSEPIDVSKFGVLYAGAQKNIGPVGITIVIVREDLLDRARTNTPLIWHWNDKAIAGSMLNTPPTFSWYMTGLVLKWLKEQGGIAKISERNQRKAKKLYATIDGSGFYHNPVNTLNRSLMNVPFTISKSSLESEFLKQAKTHGLVNLEGHRSIGGMRASIYNAMPEAGVDALVAFMKDFEEQNG